MNRNLRIRPTFSNHMNIKNPEDVSSLLIDFFTSVHIFAGIGENFPNLKMLTMGRFEGTIEFLEREDFANMQQLQELDIFKNPINSIEEDVFWDLPNLETLRIFQSQLKKLPVNLFVNSKNLKEVSFHGSQLTQLDKDLFKNNQQLEHIVFEDNKLKTIKLDLTQFANIKEINFLGNDCTNMMLFKENSRLSNVISVQELQTSIDRTCF
jgi:Leucine-rich repeat (LRR) protein